MLELKWSDKTVTSINGEMSVKDFLKKHCSADLKNVLGINLNDQVLGLDEIIDISGHISLITVDSKQGWEMINYTAGILCAAALKNLYPQVMIAAIELYEDGYYVDFFADPTIKSSDTDKINREIIKLAKNNQAWSTSVLNKNDVKNFKDLNPYLTSTVVEQNIHTLLCLNKDLTLAKTNAYSSAKWVRYHESLGLAGAYWKNNAQNQMLQRWYGTAHADKQAFDNFKAMLQDRKDRDHRKIGKELDIFMFDNLVGQGLPIWLPNGKQLKNQIQQYLYDKEWEYDFVQVETPVVGTEEMYHVSGHWDHYREDMFPPIKTTNGESLILKPMSCPHHIAIYKYQPRSYRDLPLRLAEHAIQHRYEASGALTGLERVRMMVLTDSHIFVRPDQIKSEFKRAFQLIQEVLLDFRIDIDYFSLSLRDPKNKEKYFNDDRMWKNAEEMLKSALDELQIPYKVMVGEAAFYGPKLDIQIRTALNHEITVSTLQLDFLLPERFNLTYVNDKNEHVRPIIIHRGLIGTYERFISILLEQTKGVLPLWLAPRQVAILPVDNNAHGEYAQKVHQLLKKAKFRSFVDERDERLSYKIRDAQVKKVPYQLVIGDREVTEQVITYRPYGSDEQITVDLDQFLNLLAARTTAKS